MHTIKEALGAALLLMGFTMAPVMAAPLTLDTGTPVIDGWPAVTLLADTTRALTIDQVLARRDEFKPPRTPHANLGVRREAIWLRLPVLVNAGDSGEWVLSVDYASIDRIDLYVVASDRVTRHVWMGREIPFSRRPLPSAWHAVQLSLEPGREQELLLRVVTQSSAVLPITLASPNAFHAIEAKFQMLQGLLAGVGLCLLMYSLIQLVSLRDGLFLYYAVINGGTTVFFLAYFGLGPQHLWGDNAWLTVHAAPLTALVTLVGAFLFIERALAVRELQPWNARVLRAGSAAAAVMAALFATGLVGYRTAQLAATVLGPLPMLLAIPAAYLRARGGERIGAYMLIGWGFYAIATLTMAGLLRGVVPSNFWTQHMFQFGSVFEMLIWMRVLGLRIEEIRIQAQRVHLERDALHALAHTDALTGLPNRRGLLASLKGALGHCTPNTPLAVFLLDLDGFKPINDRLGHDAGDELLVQVAHRLKGLVRASDVLARLGGDEFVIVGAVPGDAEARAIGQKILDQFQQPFDVSGHVCRVGLTIGYALAPLDGRDAESLLKEADAAMYAGKQGGRHCLRRGGPALRVAEHPVDGEEHVRKR